MLFVIAVFVVPVAAYAIMTWYENKFQSLPVIDGKKGKHYVGDFSFIDQEGKQINRNEWNNKIVVANFFFTHCPVVCPKMTTNLKKVQQSFAADNTILINSFTVDPESDSVEQLKKYATHYSVNSEKWQLLTGEKRELYRFARNELMIVATQGDGGEQDFIHSDKLTLIDKKGRIRGYYDGTSDKETNQLIHDIKKLESEN